MTINSITKKDGEVLTVGDETNKGKIKFFHDFMGQIWVAFHETPQQFKADDVSKNVGDGWVWTDALVQEYSEQITMSMDAFKKFKTIKQ